MNTEGNKLLSKKNFGAGLGEQKKSYKENLHPLNVCKDIKYEKMPLRPPESSQQHRNMKDD